MAKKAELNAYILLDRSGSMSSKWDETLSSVNAYVTELNKAKAEATITVATFDEYTGLAFDIVRDAVKSSKYKPILNTEIYPRGSTPLFDAISRTVALAEKANEDKTVIVVMTDGMENASREVTKDQAKAALDRCRNKNWQVVFLGADFDAFAQSGAVGVGLAQTLNMSAGNYKASMSAVAASSLRYGATGQNIMFSAQDRDIAVGKIKKEIK